MIKSLTEPNTHKSVSLPRTTNNRTLKQHTIVISSSDHMNLKERIIITCSLNIIQHVIYDYDC